ncbi:FeoA domain protein [Thermoplasmatales archaeon BRNA1]|nr:FeoA domain protein [Thermoplasmatales archaeon BRNA1]
MQSTTAASADRGIPISLAKAGECGTVVRITGDAGTRKFLTDLGFTVGAQVQAVTDVKGSKILAVRGSRIAVDSRMASKIYFRPE